MRSKAVPFLKSILPLKKSHGKRPAKKKMGLRRDVPPVAFCCIEQTPELNWVSKAVDAINI